MSKAASHSEGEGIVSSFASTELLKEALHPNIMLIKKFLEDMVQTPSFLKVIIFLDGGSYFNMYIAKYDCIMTSQNVLIFL